MMDIPLRSIPGRYAGVEMRSQLEIQWAKWFDRHRLAWDYEPESYDLDGLLYLPDFWLPQIRTFLEVKGVLETRSAEKLRRFARYCLDRDVTLVLGESPAGLAARLVTYSYERNEASHLGGQFSRRITLVKCDVCASWFWADPDSDLQCRACGAVDMEAAHIAATHPNAGRHAAMGDTCTDCGDLEGVFVKGGRW